jgi:endo-1,3-1,4-beta-glycanase ExoK
MAAVGTATESNLNAIAYNTNSSAMNKREPIKRQNSLIKGEPDLYQPMDADDESVWERSNWFNEGGKFNCVWRPGNIIFRDGAMSIYLTRAGSGTVPYASGEYRTEDETYRFGYYEARMKAVKGVGLVTAFFTFAGVAGEKGPVDRHNEVDIEVPGNNTTKVELNYFFGDKGSHRRSVDLGFDASQDFHNYGFKWTKDSLEWFVDGKLVHTATADIPQDMCKIVASFWPGTSDISKWLGGVYEGKGGCFAQYDWIKYTGLDSSQRPGEPGKEQGAAKRSNTNVDVIYLDLQKGDVQSQYKKVDIRSQYIWSPDSGKITIDDAALLGILNISPDESLEGCKRRLATMTWQDVARAISKDVYGMDIDYRQAGELSQILKKDNHDIEKPVTVLEKQSGFPNKLPVIISGAFKVALLKLKKGG